MKRMIDSEVSDRIKYGYDENNESHIKIEADNVDIPFLVAGGSGIYSDGQVSAPNIVTDEVSTRVADSINFANAIKATGGFTPIHTYKLDGVTTLYVIFEDVDHDGSVPNDFMGYGWIERFGNGSPCLFYYALQNGKVSVFRGLSRDTIYEYSNNSMKTSKIAKASECQAKLYRHVINLSNDSHMYSGYIVYISTSNLKVASLQDLTTLLKPSTNYIYPLTGICTGLDTRDAIQFGSKNLYLKSFDKISYENNTWYFKDNYGDTETFDTVSDTVTSL